ncbi:helix-turn-helix domain-containing protein [Cohnella abietis]|uniref:HTH cro/C1-type domain-containing protein n=1 Tax=Cohnella abietis TaxID=2507935 RepID=A0A3T1DA66_9BACL|nr:helix-turn-helix transcriptional regulator [Cohnella abietis]BBI34959.1 hypothetical protein KCTCHS21_43580 [Cohnella abietis]
MNELLIQIGQTIRILREDKNLTLDECGTMIGVTRNYLRQVENGERNITMKTLESIAKTLGVHPSELLINSSPSPILDEEELIMKLCSSKSKRDLKCVIALLHAMSD